MTFEICVLIAVTPLAHIPYGSVDCRQKPISWYVMGWLKLLGRKKKLSRVWRAVYLPIFELPDSSWLSTIWNETSCLVVRVSIFLNCFKDTMPRSSPKKAVSGLHRYFVASRWSVYLLMAAVWNGQVQINGRVYLCLLGTVVCSVLFGPNESIGLVFPE